MECNKEFWNTTLTEKSWIRLLEIAKRYRFILIGGWAVYLLTRQHKSKDIDIAVDILELEKLKQERLVKNDRLKKYEIKTGEIDIDIYVAYYSTLAIPIEQLGEYTLLLENFRVVCPEAMIVLKQAAFEARKDSIKGEKDKIDIFSLLLFTDFNFQKYAQILDRYVMKHYFQALKNIILNYKDSDSLALTPRELKLRKRDLLQKMSSTKLH